jgi:F0F1-type ATP synthase membrane subunit b/b'
MKIAQSNINIPQVKGLPKINTNMQKAILSKINVKKPTAVNLPPPMNKPAPVKNIVKPLPPAGSSIKDEYSSLKEAAAAVQRIRVSAQQELEQIRKMRSDALRYQQETATRARSDAHQLMLHTRLTTQREIEELIREASEEIQKVLADIRVIRITAQEELGAQRKFTDAAKLSSMSLSIKEELAKAERKKKKQLVVSKS